MTTIYHPNVNTVVPWQAQYTFPSQATQMHKQVVKIQPTGGTSYGTGGSKRIQILLPSDGYLNSQNSYISFDLVVSCILSGDNKTVKLGAGGVHELFKRARILYGGLVIEDIQEYGQLARIMLSHGSEKDYQEGVGQILEGTSLTAGDNALNRKFVFQPLLGLLRCQKLIPLKWMAASLILELELNEEAIAIQCEAAGTLNVKLDNVNYIAEIMEFDSIYDTAFYAGMQQMGIPMKFTSFHHQSRPVTGSEHVQIHERARSVKAGYAVIKDDANNVANADSFATIKVKGSAQLKSYQWRIGGKYQPAQPVDCSGVAPEAFLEVMKCFNTLGDYTFAPPATAASFGGDSATTFLMAQEFECTDVFPNTIAGINAENQSDLTLKLESTNSFAACTLQTFVAFDNLLILREGHLVDLVM